MTLTEKDVIFASLRLLVASLALDGHPCSRQFIVQDASRVPIGELLDYCVFVRG